MKRKTILCILCAAFMLLFSSCGTAPAIGFIDGLSFDMKPNEITARLGEPKLVQEKSEWAETYYSYEIELDGVQTAVTVTFVHDTDMFSVDAKATCDSEESAKRLLEAWKSKEIAVLENEKGYYCREPIQTSEGEYRVELGTNQGAVGVSIEISVNGTDIQISSTYMD